MSLGITPAQLERFLAMTPEEQSERIASMTFMDMLDFDVAFEMWAHRGQLPPPGEGWRVWLMMAGRGFGKTRAGAEWIHKLAQTGPRRIALVAASIDEARSVMVEGVSGLLAIARNNRVKLKWEPSLNQLTWPGGSIAKLYSGDNPDGMRGPEHHFAWALSFEVVADEAPTPIGLVLAECSDGLIEAGSSQTVAGFAAYGSSIADAIKPLVELLDIELAERGDRLSGRAATISYAIGEKELGCAVDDGPKPRIEHRRDPSSRLPASRTLVYYDPAREFQAGQMRASGGGSGQRDERIELPAVVPSGQAKQLVEQSLSRRLANTNRLRAWLPPARMNLRPGDLIRLPSSDRPLVAQSVTIDGFAVELEARASAAAIAEMPADPGRSAHEPDLPIGRTEPILIELPALADAPEAAPRICVAGSNSGQWKRVPVEIMLGSAMLAPIVLSRPAISGHSVSSLQARVPAMRDELSDVSVRLSSPDDILFNADLDALMAGANLALLGDELIQFGRAQQLGQGIFRLTGLLRGRRGTEWAAHSHQVGEPFVVMDADRMRVIDLPPSSVGASVKCTSFGIGDIAPQPMAECIVRGEAMRPPAPCHLRLTREADAMRASWVRRTHHGWAWIDGIATGPDAFPERYRVKLTGSGGVIEIETTVPTVSFELAALPGSGGEAINVDVAMIGPMALSHDTGVSFTI